MLRVGKLYWILRDSIMAAEPKLLRALNYDVEAALPHTLLLNMLRSMKASEELCRVAWALLADSMVVPETLLVWTEALVAATCIHLASIITKSELPSGQIPWYHAFGVEMEEMEEAAHTILDIFQSPRPNIQAEKGEEKKP